MRDERNERMKKDEKLNEQKKTPQENDHCFLPYKLRVSSVLPY